MSNFISTFQERFSEWVTALGTTLTIISFDLIGRYFSDHPTCGLSKWSQKAATWVLQIAGIFQTIPSMALLGLFIPSWGLEPYQHSQPLSFTLFSRF